MKKIILSFTLVLAFAFTSDAQTRKGTVLLGAGSQISDTEWTTLAITPKVGYFVQDGIAIGALINFQTDNVEKTAINNELNSQVAEIGVFSRYYVSNNLFAEISLSSRNSSSESWDSISDYSQVFINLIPQFNADGSPLMADQTLPQVVENSHKSLNFNLGMGYTIVWREHFAVEPYMNLTFMSGEQKVYNEDNLSVESDNLSGTHFNLGVNFSLFF